jgi:5-formyltetrahydrofolate cyclo-ligase
MTDIRASLRQRIQAQRQQLSPPILQQAATQVAHHISQTAWFLENTHIAFYYAVRGELDPYPLMQYAWEMGKICYLPVCDPQHPHTLCFLRHSPDAPLSRNQYGIPEPALHTHIPIDPSTLDIVFMPLLAFDATGNRLGSGKGYYDRTFAYLHPSPMPHKPELIGLAYAFQEINNLNPQAWDVPMQKAVVFDTEQQAVTTVTFL